MIVRFVKLFVVPVHSFLGCKPSCLAFSIFHHFDTSVAVAGIRIQRAPVWISTSITAAHRFGDLGADVVTLAVRESPGERGAVGITGSSATSRVTRVTRSFAVDNGRP